MFTDRPNHEPSLFMLNCGEKLPGRPSMGSWVTYGLGTENQNLPGFVVLCPGLPVVGHQLWSSTFLPAVYQGTYINTEEKGSDRLIQNIRNKSLTREQQREELDLLAKLNRSHIAQQGTRSATRGVHSIVRSPSVCRAEAPGAFRYHQKRKTASATGIAISARLPDRPSSRRCAACAWCRCTLVTSNRGTTTTISEITARWRAGRIRRSRRCCKT